MKYIWKTKDGKEINVDDMTIEHLRNVLKMIIRKKQNTNNQLKKQEVKLNGDIANMFNDDMDLFDLECEYDNEDYGYRGI